MFQIDNAPNSVSSRRPIAVILVFNVAALLLTLWIMTDMLYERDTMSKLILKLPKSEVETAVALKSELLLQFRLSVLLVVNLLATALSVVLLWRAYHVSQESLRDIRAQAIDILGSMDQVVITTDLEGRITGINERGYELLQLNSSCLGKKLREVPQLQEFEDYRLQKSSENEATPWRDYSTIRDGNRLHLRVTRETLCNREDKEIGSILQVRDITVAMLTEERMRRMSRYMELGDLVAGLYHEIKNPLAALSLHVQLISERIQVRSEESEMQEMLSVVGTELARVHRVLESFQNYASVKGLNKTATNIQQLITRQMKLIEPTALEKSVAIELESPSNSIGIIIDEPKIEQVLLNLIVNALDAMPNGGRLIIRLKQTKNATSIEVEDTGRGVPEAMRSKIFDPYFTTKSNGVGMGLALSEKIARQHGGSLIYRPVPNGSLFELTLPHNQDLPAIISRRSENR